MQPDTPRLSGLRPGLQCLSLRGSFVPAPPRQVFPCPYLSREVTPTFTTSRTSRGPSHPGSPAPAPCCFASEAVKTYFAGTGPAREAIQLHVTASLFTTLPIFRSSTNPIRRDLVLTANLLMGWWAASGQRLTPPALRWNGQPEIVSWLAVLLISLPTDLQDVISPVSAEVFNHTKLHTSDTKC